MLRILTVALIVLTTRAASAQAQLLVLPSQVDTAARSQVPPIFDEYMLAAVQSAAGVKVIGPSDLAALLDLEKQRDLLACTDTVCLAEIAGALAVERLVQFSVGVVGHDLVLTAKLVSTRAAIVEARVYRSVPGVEHSGVTSFDGAALLAVSRDMVAELFRGSLVAPAIGEAALTDEQQHLLNRFIDSGLDRQEFGQFLASEMPYAAWARLYNTDHESTALDASKWTLTVVAIAGLVTWLSDPGQFPNDERVAVGVLSASSVLLWGIDGANFGALPSELR